MEKESIGEWHNPCKQIFPSRRDYRSFQTWSTRSSSCQDAHLVDTPSTVRVHASRNSIVYERSQGLQGRIQIGRGSSPSYAIVALSTSFSQGFVHSGVKSLHYI